MAHVMLGIPTYHNQVDARMLHPLLFLSKKHTFTLMLTDSSAQCMTMNLMLARALDQRDAGAKIDYLVYWHSDIAPEWYWLDKMIEIAEKSGADVVSAISPIKDQQGLTSTAIDEPVGDCDPAWRVRRLTMKEIYDLPPSFTHPNLLVNTGLMLIDLSKPWVNGACFSFDDTIIRHHGRRTPAVMPEDWKFSRMATKSGAKLWATREVKLTHFGEHGYTNTRPWGSLDTDALRSYEPDVIAAADAADKIRGYMAWEELAWLAERARGRRVVEVGSWLGRSTKALASTATKVFAVDHWAGSKDDATEKEAKEIDVWATFNSNLGPEINSRKVVPISMKHEHLSASTTYDYDSVSTTYSFLTDEPVDMVFIDGDHSYEAAKRDIQNAMAILAPGGLLCGHDFDPNAHPGVVQAVKELVPNFSVDAMTTIWYRPPTRQDAAGSTQSEQTSNKTSDVDTARQIDAKA